MATSASILHLLFSCLALAALASASIETVCKKVITLDPAVNYGFCVGSLKAAPGGPSADDRGLAVIAGNLASNKAKNTLPKINGLLKKATKAEKSALVDCQELYGNAVDNLKKAADLAKAGSYRSANSFFSSGMDSATTCEDGFKELKVKSLLVKDDSELFQLASIGASITHTTF